MSFENIQIIQAGTHAQVQLQNTITPVALKNSLGIGN